MIIMALISPTLGLIAIALWVIDYVVLYLYYSYLEWRNFRDSVLRSVNEESTEDFAKRIIEEREANAEVMRRLYPTD